MQQKSYDSLVLWTTIGKKLVLQSLKVLVQNVLNITKKWILQTETKHGFKVLKFVRLFSLLLLSKNLHFFHEWINLYLSIGLLPVSICFSICGLREMCLSLGQDMAKIYLSKSNFYLSQTIRQTFCRSLKWLCFSFCCLRFWQSD